MADRLNGSGAVRQIQITGQDLVRIFGTEIEAKLSQMTGLPKDRIPKFAIFVWGPDGHTAYGMNAQKHEVIAALNDVISQITGAPDKRIMVVGRAN